MLLATLLLAAADASPPAEPDEVVVLARRVKEMRLALARRPDGSVVCGLSRSSGMSQVDAKLCEIARTCAKKRDRDLIEVAACVETRKPQLIAQLRRTQMKAKQPLVYDVAID